MMGRACLGSWALVVMFVMAIIVLVSIHYAAGEPNEDEYHPIKLPFNLPNFWTYTSTESTLKNFEKENRNPTYQDSTTFEIDSEREVGKTDSETSEVLQLSTTINSVKKQGLPESDTLDTENSASELAESASDGIGELSSGIDSVSAKIHHSEPDEQEVETVNKCSRPNKLSTQKSERELRRDIFRNYDKGARPVKRPLNPVKVNITIRPIILISASEKQFVLDTYMNLIWMDDYLQWDPCEYGGITELRVPVTDIWRPDVGLTTAIPDTSAFPVLLPPAIIYNYGKVNWNPQFTIRSKCASLSKNIPDSTISCNFLLGSWSHDNRFLKIEGEYGEVPTYCFGNDFNPDWELVRMFSGEHTYVEGSLTYINYNITLKSRKHD